MTADAGEAIVPETETRTYRIAADEPVSLRLEDHEPPVVVIDEDIVTLTAPREVHERLARDPRLVRTD